ncbi:MAG TPA: flagellar basal body L-ring protein FlgH [Burkholderiales bacterium]|nr:flagellar basal body L-ring protein FlgH [Burkholderiales bacterium]
MTNPRKLAAMLLMALLSGCAINQPPIVHQPMTARPLPDAQLKPEADGAIFAKTNFRPMFEDRRARFVGDTMTVLITEKTAANKKSGASAERKSAMTAAVPTVHGLPGKSFQGLGLDASSDNTFNGNGQAAASNDFTGTITVTVTELLPNGNLLVSGEKQIAMSQGTEFIRFSGIVNPVMVSSVNTIASTQVADARIEYRANGYIDEAQTMGWLARFFNNVLPF